MKCEGAGEADARTGLVSATFTLSGQVNATLSASSHFFQNAGTVWPGWGKEIEKREQRVYGRQNIMRGCGLKPAQFEAHGVDWVFVVIIEY